MNTAQRHIFSGASLLLATAITLPGATAQFETIATQGTGDVTDDPCVWLHPNDPAQSVIIGTNKTNGAAGGLYTYNLSGGYSSGSSWQSGVNWFNAGQRVNNVDLRYNFKAGAETWDIVCTSNRTTDQVDIFRVDTNGSGDFTGMTQVGSVSPTALSGDYPYGLAMYRDRASGTYHVLVSDKVGNAEQIRLTYNTGSGQIEGTTIWSADVGGDGKEIEGIVADDEKGVVYIASEDQGIFRYDTVDGVIQSADRVTVDTVAGANLTADVEGMTMYYAADGKGYLIASSQGSGTFAVYDREWESTDPNAIVGTFSIGAGTVDGVTQTDGIDVLSSSLGSVFGDGLFIAHDGVGDSPSNLKLVPWDDIADDFAPGLIIDSSWDPRAIPEPSAIGLGLGGVVALLTYRRRLTRR